MHDGGACANAIGNYPLVLDGNAPVHALIKNVGGEYHLRIESRKQGVVLDENRGSGYWFSDACRDALGEALKALALEQPEHRISPPSNVSAALTRMVPEDPKTWTKSWTGPPPVVGLILIDADRDAHDWCENAARKAGVALDRDAPVRAIIFLGKKRRVRIVSRTRGLVLDDPMGPDFGDLCNHGIASALKQLSAEGGGAAAPAARVAPSEPPAPSAVEMVPRAGAVSRRNAFALVVGISRYRDGTLPEAAGAVADAKLFAESAAQTLGVPRDHVHLLVDAEATFGSLHAQLDDWLAHHAKPGAEVFFFFAGHGAPDPASGARYLVPWDADPKFIKSQGLSVEALSAKLAGLRGARVFMFLDACFSGLGGRSVLAKGTRPIVVEQSRAPKVARKGFVFVSATGPSETTNALGNHGLFSYQLLRGLNGEADRNEDGAITVDELIEYTARKVTGQSPGQHPQAFVSADEHGAVLTRLPPPR
jgi:hypothetical protein